MAKYNPVEFIQEVRQEVAKVTWPTWKEVWITTLMVLLMVALASVFFLLTDQTIGWLVRLVLGGAAEAVRAETERVHKSRANAPRKSGYGEALVYCACLHQLRAEGG